MENILYSFTTPSQAERLLALGLDPATADMHWKMETDRMTGANEYVPRYGRSPAVLNNLFSFRQRLTLPCWSFSALFSLLPVIGHDEPQLKRTTSGGFRICYNDQESHPFVAYGDTMTDTMVDFVEQMIRAGWIFEPNKQ